MLIKDQRAKDKLQGQDLDHEMSPQGSSVTGMETGRLTD